MRHRACTAAVERAPQGHVSCPPPPPLPPHSADSEEEGVRGRACGVTAYVMVRVLPAVGAIPGPLRG